MKLSLSSEQVSPTGNVASTGILNQLGRPNLDTLAVLVREAVQNSWDARTSDTVPVRFGISGWTMNAAQHEVLQQEILADCPPEDALPLAEHMHSRTDFHVLAIYDRGTIGLGGPTRADVVTDKDKSRNFVDFLRDIGQTPDRCFSGGTYGYGKAAFYRASKIQAICVHTCCCYKGKRERRFMVSALGVPYTRDGSRYTGRHWWGQHFEGIVEPILNDEADNMAARLGMPTFNSDEYGTTILVLQPVFMDDPRQTISFIVDNLLCYFWPKMLTYNESPAPMLFEVSWQGKYRDIPYPLTFPPLRGFALAMYHLKGFNADPNSPFRHYITDIASQRPAQILGKLALQQFPISISKEPDNYQKTFFSELTHHTALMRQPELIVKYLPGIVMPNEKLGYAGVFLANPDLDAIFADAEPPTHDNWIPKSLNDRRHKIFVNVAMRNVEQEMDGFAKPPASGGSTSCLTPLGKFANNLGNSLIPSVQGPVATFAPFDTNRTALPTKSRSEASSGAAVKRASVQVLSEGEFVIVDNIPALQVEFAVMHAVGTVGTTVIVHIHAVLDGSQPEIDPPVGASQARVLYWTAPDGTSFAESKSVFIPSSSQGSWFVTVSMPEDMMLHIEMKVDSQIRL
jgi:hypothetical protein